uniref:Uncharacterized protein n=2 Tax=Macaca TaxID=9539 RepID=Q9BE92_MACFA|nr:hypothetical protein [Macaca fascicularis]
MGRGEEEPGYQLSKPSLLYNCRKKEPQEKASSELQLPPKSQDPVPSTTCRTSTLSHKDMSIQINTWHGTCWGNGSYRVFRVDPGKGLWFISPASPCPPVSYPGLLFFFLKENFLKRKKEWKKGKRL